MRKLKINPDQVVWILWSLTVFLILANSMGIISKYYFGHTSVFGLVPLFDLDREGNIPTLFTTFLMLLCSIFLTKAAIIRNRKGRKNFKWILLAAIFLFLAADEFYALHEHLIRPTREFLNVSGVFYFAWIIPYCVVVGFLAIIYARFFSDIPQRPRRLMLISAMVYLSGTIGFEMIGGWYFELCNEQKDYGYEIITTIEESLEMVGLLIFLHALMIYIDIEQS